MSPGTGLIAQVMEPNDPSAMGSDGYIHGRNQQSLVVTPRGLLEETNRNQAHGSPHLSAFCSPKLDPASPSHDSPYWRNLLYAESAFDESISIVPGDYDPAEYDLNTPYIFVASPEMGGDFEQFFHHSSLFSSDLPGRGSESYSPVSFALPRSRPNSPATTKGFEFDSPHWDTTLVDFISPLSHSQHHSPPAIRGLESPRFESPHWSAVLHAAPSRSQHPSPPTTNILESLRFDSPHWDATAILVPGRHSVSSRSHSQHPSPPTSNAFESLIFESPH